MALYFRLARVERWLLQATRLGRGCAVARLRGCAVARLRGCAVARLRGCEIRLEINSITYGKALVEPVQKYQAISAGNVLHQPKA